MSDDLDAMSDAQLNEVFAVEVAQVVRPIPSTIEGVRFYEDTRNGALRRSDWGRYEFWVEFCTDTNAVLPWLEKWRYADLEWNRISLLWSVSLQSGKYVGSGSTLARAAVIALIRFKRRV